MKKFLSALFALVFVLTASTPAYAIDFPSFDFPFPSINPFPSKTPKPTNTPTPTMTPSSSPTSTPVPVPAKLEIEDIDPSSANFMQEFTIYGTAFGNIPGSVNFRLSSNSFSSGGAPIVSWSDTEIKAKVPAVKKGSYRIQVITGDNKKSNEEKFTVKKGQPAINSTSISNINGEYELIFQGTEFGFRDGVIDIFLGDNLAAQGDIQSWSNSRVRFELPDLPFAEYGFQLSTSDGRKSSLKFFTVGN